MNLPPRRNTKRRQLPVGAFALAGFVLFLLVVSGLATGRQPTRSPRSGSLISTLRNATGLDARPKSVTIQSATWSGGWGGNYQAEMVVRNTTDTPIDRLSVRVELRDPSRSLPYYSETNDYVEIPNGIEVGETRTVKATFMIDPNKIFEVLNNAERYRAYLTIGPARFTGSFETSKPYAAKIPINERMAESLDVFMQQLPKAGR